VNEEVMNSIFRRIREATEKRDLEGIADEVVAHLNADPEDPEVIIWAAAALIDAGAFLEEVSLIQLGIELAEYELQDHLDHYCMGRFALEYNMANGYMAIHRFVDIHGDTRLADKSLQDAKRLYQNVILHKRYTDPDTLHMAITNYASLLANLDRKIEAIDFYLDALRILPTQAIAMANAGKAISVLGFMFDQHDRNNLYESWRLLSSACQLREEIITISGKATLETFESRLSRLVEVISEEGLESLIMSKKQREREQVEEAPYWLQRINRDRLLLTLNQMPSHSIAECADDLLPEYFTMVAESEEEVNRVQLFLTILNQIKEYNDPHKLDHKLRWIQV
jgi:tetratricopeptide (TPR) repeat protein